MGMQCDFKVHDYNKEVELLNNNNNNIIMSNHSSVDSTIQWN